MTLTDQARHAYADALVKADPKMANSAGAIRSGAYSNCWIAAGIAAAETCLRIGPDDEPEEGQRA